MGQLFSDSIAALDVMKKTPFLLHYKGNLDLLRRPMVSIVGSRRLLNYTRQFICDVAKANIFNLWQVLTKRPLFMVWFK